MVEVQAPGFRVLGADALHHAVDILHQLHGVLESIGVHPLDEISIACLEEVVSTRDY